MLYEYKCNKCKSVLEIERSIHAEANAPLCIDCHELMDRVWNTPGISFKGSGFYSTDHPKQ